MASSHSSQLPQVPRKPLYGSSHNVTDDANQQGITSDQSTRKKEGDKPSALPCVEQPKAIDVSLPLREAEPFTGVSHSSGPVTSKVLDSSARKLDNGSDGPKVTSPNLLEECMTARLVVTITPFGPVVTTVSQPAMLKGEALSSCLQIPPTSADQFQPGDEIPYVNQSLKTDSVKRYATHADTWPGSFRAGILGLLTKNADSSTTSSSTTPSYPSPSSITDPFGWEDEDVLCYALTRPRNEQRKDARSADDNGTTYMEPQWPPLMSGATGRRSQHDTPGLFDSPVPSFTPNPSHARITPTSPVQLLSHAPLLSHPINRDNDADNGLDELIANIERILRADSERECATNISQENKQRSKQRTHGWLHAFIHPGREREVHDAKSKQQHREVKGYFEPTLSGRGWRAVGSDYDALAPKLESKRKTGRTGMFGRVVRAVFATEA